MHLLLFLWLCLSSIISSMKCAPITEVKGMNYLMNFGYTNNKTMESMNKQEMKEAIQEFQKNVHIPVTGVLDEETKKMMEVPRCLMPDTKIFEYTGRWNHTHLTYLLSNYPRKFYNKTVTEELVRKGMKLWLDEIDLVTEEYYDDELDPNIYIQFVETATLATDNGVVIAYAAPPANGDMYFLKDISDYQIDLYQVIAHEFGHSLGLNHLNDINSVMYPYFIYKDNFSLNSTDKEFIEVLYGKKYSPCQFGHFDAAFFSNSQIYIFRGFQLWKYYYGNLEDGYPKLLSEEFPGLRSSVNATFYYNEQIYFIQKKEVLKFNGTNVEHFHTLEREYEAAVTIGERLYTFKGFEYWRYDINDHGMSTIREDYPRNISRLWKGVPGDIDAVYYDGDAHFFKGTRYFKFDTNALVNDAVEKPITEWEGCKNN